MQLRQIRNFTSFDPFVCEPCEKNRNFYGFATQSFSYDITSHSRLTSKTRGDFNQGALQGVTTATANDGGDG